jgi:hypothetical protein
MQDGWMDGWMDDMWTRNTLFGCILVLYVTIVVSLCTHHPSTCNLLT